MRSLRFFGRHALSPLPRGQRQNANMQARQVLGGGGDFLLAVLAASVVAYPDAAPLIRQDNVRIDAAAAFCFFAVLC